MDSVNNADMISRCIVILYSNKYKTSLLQFNFEFNLPKREKKKQKRNNNTPRNKVINYSD